MAKSTTRIHLCYYITGHGLGHATRCIELIRSILEDGRFIVHIVSPVREEFFTSSLKYDKEKQSLIHYPRTLDTGAIQTSPLNVDPHATLDSYYTKIHENRQGLVDYEVSWLKTTAIEIVLVDATPIGCIAAKQANKVVVLVTNFTWDVMYQEMLKSLQYPSYKKDNFDHDMTTIPQELLLKYQDMIDQISTDLAQCDRYIQLPGETPPPPQCANEKIKPGPLIVRIADAERQIAWRREIVSKYQADLDPKALQILLLGFGGHAADWKLQDEFLPSGWICLVLGVNKDTILPSHRFIPMSHDSYVPDLIALSDAVLGKIGYGFVSECLANSTPLVYVPRTNWPEEPFVETLLTKHNAGVLMPSWDFDGGQWEGYLQLASVLKREGWVIEKDICPLTATRVIIALIDEVYAAALVANINGASITGPAAATAELKNVFGANGDTEDDREAITEIPLD